jgi:ABC-type microcin C transport system permease subunit YejE
MVELLSAIIGALIGSLASAIFGIYYGLWDQKRRRKLETTVSLYQEYQTHSMLNHRIRAAVLCRCIITRKSS